MKKIFTLLFAVTMVASAFAQYGQNNGNYGYGNGPDRGGGYGQGNDVVYGNDRYDNDRYNRHRNDYYFSKRDRDFQLAQINRMYDDKIQSLHSRWFMSRSRREQIICNLEEQRKDEIRSVFAKYNSPNNRYDDRDYKRRW